MTTADPFWRLLDADTETINSSPAFFERMRSKSMRNVIYLPSELAPEKSGRTIRVEDKVFERVSFSKTKIKEIVFNRCIFDRCLFIDSEIIDCEFHACDFIMTNTYKFSLRNTYISPNSFRRSLDARRHQNIGVHLYQMLMRNSRDQEQIEFERDAQFLFYKWKRYQEAYEAKKAWLKCEWGDSIRRWSWVIARWVGEKLFGSGVRLRHFIATVFAALFIVTSLNFLCRSEFGLTRDGEIIQTVVEAFYFSAISLTTLGYGDIVPTTPLGRVWAALQSVIGFISFALLASMLFRRVAP